MIVAFGETTKTKERKFFNDVYALSNGFLSTLLDFTSREFFSTGREWNLLNITGRVPILPRSNHSATGFPSKLYIIYICALIFLQSVAMI